MTVPVAPPKVPGRSRRDLATPGILDPALLGAAVKSSFPKLNPATLVRNPVMFVVEIGALITTVIAVIRFTDGDPATGGGFALWVAAWLWFTVLFANFAEAMAEARGKAQADSLRATRAGTTARKLVEGPTGHAETIVDSTSLRSGDLVRIESGEIVPGDGEVVEGVAYVNEAAITGESAPVLKEPGTDIRSSVTGGTTVVSDWLIVRITADPGETFLDRMIALVEGANRQKTPNEIALSLLLSGLTMVFLVVCVTLLPDHHAGHPGVPRRPGGAGGPVRHPDPDHHRRAALRHRHRRHGPGHPVQRDGQVGPRRRGRRRLRHAAARQDRHHHVRQPDGSVLLAAHRCRREGTGRGGRPRLLPRRHPRGPLGGGPGPGEGGHRRGRARRRVRALLGVDPAVGRHLRRERHLEGRRVGGPCPGSRRPRRARGDLPNGWQDEAPPRSEWSPTGGRSG